MDVKLVLFYLEHGNMVDYPMFFLHLELLRTPSDTQGYSGLWYLNDVCTLIPSKSCRLGGWWRITRIKTVTYVD